MIRTREANLNDHEPVSSVHAFRQGVVTELLNPKTALFFLSFLAQFVNPRLGNVVFQLLILGTISVALNTTVDLVVVFFAAPLGRYFRTNTRFRRNQRIAGGHEDLSVHRRDAENDSNLRCPSRGRSSHVPGIVASWPVPTCTAKFCPPTTWGLPIFICLW